MKRNVKKWLLCGSILFGVFLVWTVLVQKVDLKPLGVNGTDIGFATMNLWFLRFTGVHMEIYHITDWLGLVPVFICLIFGIMGVAQLIRRRSLLKVDCDLICLGIYYVIVLFAYLIFEMLPINYRPILIEGFMEASYPSSTTLLVLCVMLTLVEQLNRRSKNEMFRIIMNVFIICFSGFMVLGRLVSGVHWLTDIVGSVMLSVGLFCIYKACVLFWDKGNS